MRDAVRVRPMPLAYLSAPVSSNTGVAIGVRKSPAAGLAGLLLLLLVGAVHVVNGARDEAWGTCTHNNNAIKANLGIHEFNGFNGTKIQS